MELTHETRSSIEGRLFAHETLLAMLGALLLGDGTEQTVEGMRSRFVEMIEERRAAGVLPDVLSAASGSMANMLSSILASID